MNEATGLTLETVEEGSDTGAEAERSDTDGDISTAASMSASTASSLIE